MLIQERFSRNEWYKSTVQKLFYEVCLDRPDKTAIVYGGDNISYAALQDRVNRLAGSLLKLGIGKGDRVCMLPSPTPDFVCLYFAVLQIGAVINPLNLLWGQIEFTGVLRRNDPKAIVTVDQYGGRNYIQLLRDSIPDLELRGDSASSKSIPALARLICCSKEGKKHEGFLDFHSLIEGGAGYDKAAMHKQIMDAKPST
jgi:fatty-acyl-CoA synthase